MDGETAFFAQLKWESRTLNWTAFPSRGPEWLGRDKPQFQAGAPRISFFLPGLWHGGVEQVTVKLAQGFAARGYDPEILAGNARDRKAMRIPKEVSVVDLESRRIIASTFRLADYLRKTRPIALFSAKTHANVVAIVARMLSGVRIPHFVCEHSHYQLDDPGSVRDRVAVYLASKLYSRADGLIAVSKDVAEAWNAKTKNKDFRATVIHNPVVTPDMYARLRRPATLPEWFTGSETKILGVGRLVAEKDFKTLIRAFSTVRSEIPSRLIILGEGPERKALEELSAQLGVDDDIILPGFVEDPLPFMARADLFVLSSSVEAFPMVLGEALFAGCPIVATRCSQGVMEILDHGRFGRLVPVRRAEVMAEAITEAIGARSADSGTRLRARAEEFSLDTAVSKYEALIMSRCRVHPLRP